MATLIPNTFNLDLFRRHDVNIDDGARGIFQDAINRLFVRGTTDQPTVQLSAPYIPPADALEAQSVSDMVTIQVPFPMDWVYEVGKKPIDYKLGILITNKCLENELRISIDKPAYLTSDTPTPFIVPPLTVYNLGFTLIEQEAVNRIVSGQTLFSEDFSISTTVLQVTGPVYVKPHL